MLASSSTAPRPGPGPLHRVSVSGPLRRRARRGGVRSVRPGPARKLARCSRPSAIKRVAAVLKALEAPLLVELAEVAQNLAPVTGAERRHELEISGGAFGERRFKRAVRALWHLRRVGAPGNRAVSLSARGC